MEGFTHQLPGLFDDPQFQDLDFPPRSGLHIAPLRNPVPSRTFGIPSPLEPQASHDVDSRPSEVKLGSRQNASTITKKTPPITPATIIHARDARKPITAISELLESTTKPMSEPVIAQLPSFVSLSVVEKTYLSPPLLSQELRGTKRPRLELDMGLSDDYIHLPRPQQQHQGPRAPPLLPAIVNGIHEPPPNAALLPPMATEKQSRRENAARVNSMTTLSSSKGAAVRPPEKMLNSPELSIAESIMLPELHETVEVVQEQVTELALTTEPEKPHKARKTPRKWTVDETQHLLRGVEKHGFGKWKLILEDSAFSFNSRTAVDLKDRYRVCITNKQQRPSAAAAAGEPLAPSSPNTTNMPSSTLNIASKDIDSSPPESDAHATPVAAASSSTSGRRARRAWTTDEDENLLKGMARYGFQWTLIHDDVELNLSHRKATDLRDRIRNKYSEGYKNAKTALPKSQQLQQKNNAGGGGAGSRREKDKDKDGDTSSPAQQKSQAPGPGAVNGPSTKKTNKTAVSSVTHGRSTTELQPPDRAEPSTAKIDVMDISNANNANTTTTVGENGELHNTQEQPGMTLPPLALDGDDWDWGDNTLPPLMDLEDMGMGI